MDPTPTVRVVPSDPKRAIDREEGRANPTLVSSLGSHALAGAAAAMLIGAVELVDVHVQLSPVFHNSVERLWFTTYFSVNLLSGSAIGFLVGAVALASSFLHRRMYRLISRGPASFRAAITGLAVGAIAAVVLNQHPQIHGFAMTLLREGRKLLRLNSAPAVTEALLSYLLIMALFGAGALAFMLVRRSDSWTVGSRGVFSLALLGVMGAAYYLDSRVEVQQYEYSLHRAMFILGVATSMMLAGSVDLRRRARSGVLASRPIVRMLFPVVPALAASACLVFTFVNFDKNHNLKTLIFYRTTQAKQHFKLVQWALDFDRDGYSAILGGGDLDDSDPEVNPGAIEVVGDGIDNNGVGGDLTREAIEDWRSQLSMAPATRNPDARRLNIIFFFIDTVRADHLGAYGYDRNTSPNIDKLATKSSVFRNAYTPSPYTYEAAPKFMQSAYWDAHLETWTEVLKRNGYRMILFPRRLSMLLRYVKGMDEISDRQSGWNEQIGAVIEVLGNASADRPFCAYIYSLDPHRPYRTRPGFHFGPSTVDKYDAEIAYTDHHLGRLFDWLETSGRMDDTMVVIMSDHGESMGERMVYKHNSQLYDDQMRVPLICYVPGLSPRVIHDYVTTVDLGATILDVVGIDYPKEYVGVSLLPLMRDEPFVHPPVYGEHAVLSELIRDWSERGYDPESRKFMVVTQDGHKLIYNRNFSSFELYDLKADPGELRNLYDRMTDKSAEMKRLLGRFIDVVGVLRPRDADEYKFFRGQGHDEDGD